MIFEPQAADRKVRVFSLSQSFLEQFKNRQPKWGFGGLGYFTYKRCVTVDTPVLCDDLVWRPAGSLDKGQGIIGFDEDPVRVHHHDYRYIRLGTVMHNSIEEAEVMGIRLEDGTVLYAMPDHPWLVKYAVGNRVYWRETKDLQATKKGGDVYLMRPFGPVWDVDKTYEGGFLSAAYDGEGSLDRLNGVTFTQKDNVFLARVENYLTAKGVPYKKSLKKGKTGHMFVLRTHGLRHLLPLLGSLQPPRLLMKFKEGVAKNLAGTMLRCAPEDWVKVVSIFPAGVRHIAVLSTDIKTHFTGGFASHNTYARELPDGTTEEWWQTCQRVVEGCFNIQKIHCRQMGLPWKEDKAQGSAQDMFQRMWDFKFTPPGRGLWVMGTDLVYDRGSAALQNCAFVSTDLIGEDFAAPFCFLMDMSMLGVGVGGDTRGAGRVRIITPRLTEDPYVVADSREGWVDLLRTVLNSFVGKNAFPTVIDYSKVRGRGTPIKTFGGIASGPKPLHMLIEGVTRLLLPKGVMVKWDVDWRDDQGRIELARATFSGSGDPFRISSTQIVDVFNYVGKCVVAGGVRRTAEIMFGEPDDTAFLTLKQDQEALLDRRWASNNSIFARVGMDYSAVVESAAINGEPGIMWLDNSRAFGRMADPPDYKDRKIMGTNPCVTGDTITMTSEGPRRGDQLVGQPFKAYLGVGKVSLNIDSTPEGFFVTGQKPVYLLQTKEGHSLKLTLDHPMHVALRVTRDGVECADIPAGELQPGAMLVLNNTREIDGWSGQGTYNEGWLLGSMLGDGHLHKGDGGYAVLQFWGPSRKVLLDSALSKIKSLGGPEHYHDQRTGSEIEERDCCVVKSKKVWELAAEFGITPDKEFTSDALLLASSEFQRGFLCGLFDADGSVQGSQEKGVSVRLSSSTKQHLIFAQRMLLGLGINSTIYWNRREAGERLLPDGHGGVALYPTKDQHELVISKDNLLRFQEVVGFCDPDKSEALVGLLGHYRRTLNRERFLATFESLTYLGVETVYDCTIPQNHHFSANGFVTHNCGEQPLESFELCNLVETYPAHHDTYEDFERTLKMAYLYAKTVTLVPTHDPRANAVMTRNRRIGCSMSGITQAMKKLGRREFLNWCDKGYAYLGVMDQIYSDWLGVPLSIKKTSVKPSGTVSLLCGATPGIHYPHSEYYIRWVRVANTSPLVQACVNAGYEVHPDPYADDTSVVGFPVHEENFSKGKDHVTVWEQFVNAVDMQNHWADNQVSVTITFRPNEKGDLKTCLETFETSLKGLSMLPAGDEEGHGYKFPPYQAIDRDQYEAMMSRISPLNFSASTHDSASEDRFCSNDSCMVRLPDTKK